MSKFGSGHNSRSLLDENGERKYMNARERRRFYFKRYVIKDMVHRTLVEVLYWTGCRISEALELMVKSFDLFESTITIRTLKQRKERKHTTYRVMKIPRFVMWRLNRVHKLRKRQDYYSAEKENRLWMFSRQKGLGLVKTVCNAARMEGKKCTCTGLRHSFAVALVMRKTSLSAVSQLLGHADVEVTMIYASLKERELHTVTRRSWNLIEVFG